jgi:hypothetical protein
VREWLCNRSISETVALEWDKRTTSGEQRGGRVDAEWSTNHHGWESNHEKRTTLASREVTTSVRTMVVAVITDAFPALCCRRATVDVLVQRRFKVDLGKVP